MDGCGENTRTKEPLNGHTGLSAKLGGVEECGEKMSPTASLDKAVGILSLSQPGGAASGGETE